MAVKVLLDTDIGSDIDDAVCLAYLLCQPVCDLVGITTVTGEPQRRAMLASAVCRAAGRDEVPIFAGAETPILVAPLQPAAPQAEALEQWPHRTDFEPNAAVAFLRDTIRANPGEVTLLTIGPLTNIGLLFALDPEMPGMLADLVSMCGYFGVGEPWTGDAEWNARGDPHATAIVYAARPPRHLSVGLDVTRQCRMPTREAIDRFVPPPLDCVADLARVYGRTSETTTFHDPLAGALIFEPDLCDYADGEVEIELAGPQPTGVTHWHPGGAETHRVAAAVNADRFFEHYFGVFQ